jgi:hypothetical protein
MVHQIPFRFFLRDLGYETELVLPTYSGENGPQKAVDREAARAAVRSFSGEAPAQEVVQLLPRGLLLLCHTPFQERGNEASIRVPRMFKSHAWQQYDKQMQCYKITSNISYITTRGSEKDYIKAAEITKRSAAPQA